MKRLLVALLAFSALAISHPGAARAAAERLVYVGTFTAEFNPNSQSKGIYAFRLNEDTGALSPLGLVATTVNPSYLTASKDGRFLFATNELQMKDGEPAGFVTSYLINKATGMLTPLSSQLSKGAGPCQLALDQTGRYLAVANYNGGTFALFPVGTDGKLAPLSQLVAGEPTNGADGAPLPHLAHMVQFDATNKYLIADDKGLNKLVVFKFDASKGTLTPNDPPSVSIPQAKSGPRHFVLDPKERFLYSLGEQAAAVTSFAWDAKRGTLTPTGTSVSTRPGGVTGGSTAEIRMHPSGKFLYASNRSSPGTIAVFAIGPRGTLTLVEHQATLGNTPRGVNVDPSGKWLISTNQGTGNILAFRIDQATGALEPVGDPQPVPMPVDVLVVN